MLCALARIGAAARPNCPLAADCPLSSCSNSNGSDGFAPVALPQGNHQCVERAMHQNCPICFEFLFESVDPTTVLKCGHTIHTQCVRVSTGWGRGARRTGGAHHSQYALRASGQQHELAADHPRSRYTWQPARLPTSLSAASIDPEAQERPFHPRPAGAGGQP